jgi:hypothetical protein
VAETIDWAIALVHLHRDHLDEQTVEHTLGLILKDHHDREELQGEPLARVLQQAQAQTGSGP